MERSLPESALSHDRLPDTSGVPTPTPVMRFLAIRCPSRQKLRQALQAAPDWRSPVREHASSSRPRVAARVAQADSVMP